MYESIERFPSSQQHTAQEKKASSKAEAKKQTMSTSIQVLLVTLLVLVLVSGAQSYEIGHRLRGIANKIIATRRKVDAESIKEKCPYVVGPCNRVMQNPVVCGDGSDMRCEYDSLCEGINSGFKLSECEEINIASRAEEPPIP